VDQSIASSIPHLLQICFKAYKVYITKYYKKLFGAPTQNNFRDDEGSTSTISSGGVAGLGEG
jgi:hypothetical protein